MEIILAVLVAAIVAFVVYLIMGVVEPLARYAQVGAVLAFLAVLFERLGGKF